MVETNLNKLENSKKLISLMDNTPGFKPLSAIWILNSEDDNWRFLLSYESIEEDNYRDSLRQFYEKFLSNEYLQALGPDNFLIVPDSFVLFNLVRSFCSKTETGNLKEKEYPVPLSFNSVMRRLIVIRLT